MAVFILIVLLIAAIFGVLTAVLKLAAVIILGTILAVVFFGALIWWAIRRQTRRFMKDFQASGEGRGESQYTAGRHNAGTVDVEGHVKPPPELPT